MRHAGRRVAKARPCDTRSNRSGEETLEFRAVKRELSGLDIRSDTLGGQHSYSDHSDHISDRSEVDLNVNDPRNVPQPQ